MTKLTREVCMFNAKIESEARPLRVYGYIGLVPDVIDGKTVHKSTGGLTVEPNVDDNVTDPYFIGLVPFDQTKPPSVTMNSQTCQATVIGSYGGKNAIARLQIQKDGQRITCVIEPYTPKTNEVVPPDQWFEPVSFDTDMSDFSANSWEYFTFIGVD